MQVTSTVGYRRNGKKQACEPCRKGKMACDHGFPYCGRCVRRMTTQRCIYHPAPMTRTTFTAVPGTTVIDHGNTSSLHRPQASLHIMEAGSQSFLSTGDRPSRYHSKSVQTTTITPSTAQSCTGTIRATENKVHTGNSQTDWKSAVYQRSARFYGPTSFSAVFSEPDEDILVIGDDVRKHPGSWVFGQPLLGRNRPDTPNVRRTHVMRVLWNIPSRATSEALFSRFRSLHDSTLDPTMISHCVASLWQHFGTGLQAPRIDENLVVLSDVLFNNEESPLPSSPEHGFEWLNTFMGPSIRFEMLGLLFTFFGLAYMSLQDTDVLFDLPEIEDRDRKQISWRMKECADVCLKMCEASETVNFLVAALIFNVKVLESCCTGDETYKIRRLNGDMATATITSGLHRLPCYANSRLTSASEYKKRLFSAIYCSDKIHSSLNGTPPLLHRLFCSIEPCLDLDPGTPYLTQDVLAAAIESLDGDGWNTQGSIYATTILRAKLKLSVIREEILELALGVNAVVSKDIVDEMRLRCRDIYNSFPAQLHYSTEDSSIEKTSGAVLYERAYIMLQHLQNTFLLHRVALTRGLSDSQGLIESALKMLDISLMFWMKRDQLMVFSSGFDWIITYYGVPSAGVICIELLRQSAASSSVQFSRSDAVQKLTLFIGFLEWIRPTHGNYKLAQRLQIVVKRVLDQVLEQDYSQPDLAKGRLDQTISDPMLASFDELDDFNWLNTIDWTQESWIEYN